MKIDYNYLEKKELEKRIKEASKAYDEGKPFISDKEWDNLYFDLEKQEKETNEISKDSPTQTIYFEKISELNKIEHEHLMLSLPKTKEINELDAFIQNYDYLLMAKMDGLTCSLTYENGELVRAETRGDGKIGEDILHNAKVIDSIPNNINYKERLVVDGEIICTYNDFKDFESEFKNPRNFAAGSIRLLDSEECSKRKLTFVAWDVIEGYEESDNLHSKLEMISSKFNIVPWSIYNNHNFEEEIEYVKEQAKILGYPIDGVVAKYESKKLRDSLPSTGHHLGGAIAFKFYDEEYPTELLNIEWTMGRTGVLTPVAIFKPIEIDGSTVERASLHNLTIMEETVGKEPAAGDTVYVYKANQIIPQISKYEHNVYTIEHKIHIPTTCPICGGDTKRHESEVSDTEVLICTNPNCPGKLINQLDHYCGKKGLDIKGLSKKTLEKLIEWNWVEKLRDLYTLKDHREEWIQKSGFGIASVDKILKSIEKNSNEVKLASYISALGIPLIGQSVSQELVKHIKTYDDFRDKVKNHFDFSEYDNIAENKTEYIYNFDYTEADYIVNNGLVTFADEYTMVYGYIETLKEQTIVITGTLNSYKNRDEMATAIVNHGGKVAGSVSTRTSILINNDINSNSAKNKKAKELNIPILTEEEFIEKYLT